MDWALISKIIRVFVMRELFNKYFQEDSGATAIEYSLIATGISIAVAGTVYLIGDDVVALYEGLIGLL